MKTQNKKGFTLVEILIVVMMIGVLWAIMLPAVKKARDVARENQQIGEAAITSIDESHEDSEVNIESSFISNDRVNRIMVRDKKVEIEYDGGKILIESQTDIKVDFINENN